MKRPRPTTPSTSTAVSTSASDLTPDELNQRYHAVIYAYGSGADRKLGSRR